MLPNDSRRTRRGERARRRPGATALERLEDRQLLAATPIGIPLPDITVSGTTAPVAAWGGPLAVDLTVSNRGAASQVEPNAIYAGSTSTADSPATTVNVYVSTKPHFNGRSVLVGTVEVPSVTQNSIQQVVENITLPSQPSGFPSDGGNIYVEFKLDPTSTVDDRDRTDNTFVVKTPIEVAAPLPDLAAINLSVPSSLQPGDTISASVKVANYGTLDTDLQAPVVVDLVASTNTSFGPGDIVVAQATISNISPLSEVASSNTVLGDVNVQDPANVVTVTFPAATLPGAPPATYYLGVIVDPSNAIREIHEIGTGPSTALSPVVVVGPPITNLPPAGVISTAGTTTNVFPTPVSGSTNIYSSTVAAPDAAPVLPAPTSPDLTDFPVVYGGTSGLGGSTGGSSGGGGGGLGGGSGASGIIVSPSKGGTIRPKTVAQTDHKS